VVQDSAGNLYGTTGYGGMGGGPNCGNFGCGTIFRLDTTGKETVLHSFVGTDGHAPRGSLIRDAAGNLYGNTYEGGSFDCQGPGCGTLFKLDTRGAETILHVFLSTEPYGIIPFGGLIRDRAGNLYGTTNAGGAFPENGTIFKLDPAGVMTVLYNFMGGTDGSGSFAPLIQDSSGNLYGTTELGGDPSCKLLGTSLGCGTVFKLDAVGRETVLYRFKGGRDGGFLEAGLVMDAAGKLYGTTSLGGNLACNNNGLGCGVVWEVTPQSAQ
jgi:uncharacterized repeat protein (TIGR03803 family)